jgi:DNA-binding NtrC family response regulator
VAGLDDTVFSDTLLGHAKGAFTGADHVRAGLIERAANGTLFLDEIGDLSSTSQVKLLRLLQEKEYLPLGQDSPRKSSARIITSTHVDLWDLQQKDLFRQDLHYRLRTHRLLLPPLRDRKEDIGILLEHFARLAADALKKTIPQFPQELLGLLETYHFPGNVRELQAMVFDAVAQHKRGTLSLAPFRNHIAQIRKIEHQKDNASTSNTIPFIFSDPLPTLKEVTRMLIEEAMLRAGNNQTTAASMLGISQQALSKRLKNLTDK